MPVIGEYVSRISPPAGRQTVGSNVGLAAAPAEATAGIGGTLTDFGARVLDQISQAEDAMELATLRGKGGEIRNAAFNTITTTQDSAVREQIFNKAWQDYNAITSKRPNVQRVFDAEKKTAFAGWQADFNTINNRLRVQNVKAQFALNYDQLLEQGNLAGALQLLNTAKGTMAITPAEFDFYKNNMEADSAIAQSRILIGENDPQSAIAMLEGLKGLSGEQLDRRDSLLRIARQTQVAMSDAFGKSILKDMYEADKKPLTPLQRSEMADSMKSKALDPNNGLSIAESRTLISDIEKWEKGEFERNDEVYWKLLRQVTADPESITENEIADRVFKDIAPKDYKELVGIWESKDSPLKTPRAKAYFERLDELYSGREMPGEEGAEQMLKWDIANEKLVQFFKDNPKANANQVAEFYADIAGEEVNDILGKVWDFYIEEFKHAGLPAAYRAYEMLTGKKKPEKKAKEPKKKLTPDIARQYLNLAGGDRQMAEELAKDAGYEW